MAIGVRAREGNLRRVALKIET